MRLTKKTQRVFKITQIADDRVRVWTQAWLYQSHWMQTPCMWRSASFYSSRLQDSHQCCLPDSSLLQKRHRTQTQQQSPSLGIRNSQKEADGEILDAKAHSRETSACCPMSFNTERCANSAGLLRKHAKSVCNFSAHSILIGGFPFILPDASWPVGMLCDSESQRVQASDSQKLAVLIITSFMLLSAPLLSAKGRTSQDNSKGQGAENSLGHSAAILSRCSSSEHYFCLNHQHPGLRVSCSLDSSLSWSLWETQWAAVVKANATFMVLLFLSFLGFPRGSTLPWVAFHVDQSSPSSQKGSCAAHLWCLEEACCTIISDFSTLKECRLVSEKVGDVTVKSMDAFPSALFPL